MYDKPVFYEIWRTTYICILQQIFSMHFHKNTKCTLFDNFQN